MRSMDEDRKLEEVFDRWFAASPPGAYVMFDGQFGSTGKGVLAGLIAETVGHQFGLYTTNQGPNSGHSFYYGKNANTKVVLKQLPVAGVVHHMKHKNANIFLNSGAVLNLTTLNKELCDHFNGVHDSTVRISTSAAVIGTKDLKRDEETRAKIGGTGQGVGPAIADKIRREPGSGATMSQRNWDPEEHSRWGEVAKILGHTNGDFVSREFNNTNVFVEVAQGWDLGIHGGFYPYVTARECGVAQALADARIAPAKLRKSIVSLRTYPIRVAGPEDGTSGPGWPDQHEISWDKLGAEPEYTTVTGKVRRVFTWSNEQFRNMLRGNRPDAIFINFLNYLPDNDYEEVLANLLKEYGLVMGAPPDFILGGFGPRPEDVKVIYAK